MNLLETKVLLNSIISDANKGARFISADEKNRFLANLMSNLEHVRKKYEYILEDIRIRYRLNSKVTDVS